MIIRSYPTDYRLYPSRFNLLYEFQASDWTSGNWTMTTGGYTFTKTGSPTKVTDSTGTYIECNLSNYFSYPSSKGNLLIPRDWMFEITFMRTAHSTSSSYVVDWGSLGSATNGGIGFTITTAGRPGTNCKPTGTSAAGNISHTAILLDNTKYTVRWGCRYSTPTQDIQWIEVNGILLVSATPHDSFTGLTNPTGGRWIGRGWSSSTQYGGSFRIYSVKIYEDTQT